MGRTLIVIFGRYPEGGAGAKRVRQLARGLVEAGDEVAVIGYCRGPQQPGRAGVWMTDEAGIDHASVGLEVGTIRNPRVLLGSLSLSARLARLASLTVRERKVGRVLLYGATWAGLGRVATRLYKEGVPMVADLNEWYRWRQGTRKVFLDQAFFRRFSLTRVQGLVGISSFWRDYAVRQGKPVIVIPALADDEFEVVRKPAPKVFNLVYVGILFRRDLPETMLHGVRLAVERGCSFRFVVLGQPGGYPEAQTARYLLENDPVLRTCSEITGWVTREKLKEIYQDAGAFLLLRADEWESRASSATRLPEFLATGRPVITSETADISPYLQHDKSAWLLPAGHEPEKLADAIEHLSRNRAEGHCLGAAGREVALTQLDFRAHGRRLRAFLDGIEAGRVR